MGNFNAAVFLQPHPESSGSGKRVQSTKGFLLLQKFLVLLPFSQVLCSTVSAHQEIFRQKCVFVIPGGHIEAREGVASIEVIGRHFEPFFELWHSRSHVDMTFSNNTGNREVHFILRDKEMALGTWVKANIVHGLCTLTSSLSSSEGRRPNLLILPNILTQTQLLSSDC